MRQLAEQLRALNVPSFPCWKRFDETKHRWLKGPAVPKGEPWLLTAWRPVSDPQLDWSSNTIGVPVPQHIVVFDLDAYKGAAREVIDQVLGVALPWIDAHIQNTISGGQHYAFRCSWDVRQGDSLLGVEGFDIRAAGRGFICSGDGYAPVKHGGVLAFGNPEVLPELPDSLRPLLERVEAPPTERVDHQTADDAEVVAALKHIDPACSRSEWRNVGFALRGLYRDADAEGMALFDAWSAGEFWDGEAPHNYVPDGKGSVEDQWPTFKAEGGVNPSTLFYYAIQNGWRPPAKFDAASAFGQNAAAADVFGELLDRIRDEGADTKSTPGIIDAIQAAGCNALQVALLAAELKTELNGAGIRDKSVAAHIDGLLRTKPPAPATPDGHYGKNDTDNAAIFLEKFYPDGALCRCDEEFYAFTGKAWEVLTAATIKGQIYQDMAAQRMNESKMAACYRTVTNLVPVRDGTLNTNVDGVIIFQNGVLDVATGQLLPHDRSLFTTNVMPYNYNPSAQCPNWLAFLFDAFSNDVERVHLLQEWFGYQLVRSYLWQKMMFLIGAPRCGKGTVGRLLGSMVGKQNFSGGHLSAFASDSFLAGLRTKNTLFIGDAAKRVPPNKSHEVTERLKSISGNDEINFDRKFMSALSETLPTRITLAANSVPQLFDDSGALASRLLVLTFDKSYLGAEDLTLGDRLHAELEGIAIWALEGLRRLNTNGRFTVPVACADEAALIAEAYSPVKRFVDECCLAAPDTVTPSGDLYDAYRAWALAEGEEPMRPKSVVGAIRDAFRGKAVKYGVHWIDGRSVRGFKGLRLYDEARDKGMRGAFQPKVIT